jgi:phosphatidate cytidylyltransferase
MSGLARRLLTAGVVLPPIVLAIYAGPRWLAIVIALLAVWGARELARIHRACGGETTAWLPAAGAVLLVAVQGRFVPIALPGAVVMIIVASMVVELFRRGGSMLGALPFAVLASMYLGLLPAHLLGFYRLGGADAPNPWPVYAALVLVWSCDTAAYLVGSRFGRHRLWPRVSPSKTWEGSIAGVVASVLVAWGIGFRIPALPPYGRIVAGALVGVFAQVGDLAESLMKREAAIKDSGRFFPGHGGVLDRTDSIALAVPVLYYWLAWVLRGKG